MQPFPQFDLKAVEPAVAGSGPEKKPWRAPALAVFDASSAGSGLGGHFDAAASPSSLS